MAKLVKDALVKVGSYTDREGNEKSHLRNIGGLFEGDDGGQYLLIDPFVNLGAIQRPQGRDKVMVHLYDPRPKEDRPARQDAPRSRPPVEDEIPF